MTASMTVKFSDCMRIAGRQLFSFRNASSI
jgi:hypothetical protein